MARRQTKTNGQKALSSIPRRIHCAATTDATKGITGQVDQGLHLGAIPFGYEWCWLEEGGQRHQSCDSEHPGGVHPVPKEAEAVRELFRRYATEHSTFPALASWLNGQGFRTKNKKKLPDGEGNLSAGPKLFTTASVRGILHNAFHSGKIKHRDNCCQVAHEPLISYETFEPVLANLTKNSGRSPTLAPHP